MPGKSMFHPQDVRYIFRLESSFGEQLREHLNGCRKQVDEEAPIEVQRYWAKKRRYKQFDISPYLKALDFTNDQIEVACDISQSGTVRVDELMQWLHITPAKFREPVCRTEINWRQN